MLKHGVAVLAVGGLCLMQVPEAEASHSGDRFFVEFAVPSTGFNRAMGVPIWEFPPLAFLAPIFGDFVVLAGFRTSGAFDPGVGIGGGNSAPFSPATPPNALVATHFDAFGMSLLGVDPSTVPDDKLNVPLDTVEVLVDDFGVQRDMISCAADSSDPKEITRAGPCDEDITVDDWMGASGVSFIACHDDGTATLNQFTWDLRPNRMYSMWYVTENFAAGPQKTVTAIPFGGVPNLIVTNKNGFAHLRRDLGFCPHDQPQALGWVVAMRSNGQNYGGVPVPFLNTSNPATAFEGYEALFPGTVINVQLSFNINGVAFDPSSLPPP